MAARTVWRLTSYSSHSSNSVGSNVPTGNLPLEIPSIKSFATTARGHHDRSARQHSHDHRPHGGQGSFLQAARYRLVHRVREVADRFELDGRVKKLNPGQRFFEDFF